jgi:hypothetical protein
MTPEEIQLEIKMTEAQAQAFLEALLEPTQRARLRRYPRKFLQDHGITIADAQIPKPVELPSIAELELAYNLTGVLHPDVPPFAHCVLPAKPSVRPFATCFVWSSAFIAISAAKPKPKKKSAG